MEPVRSLAILTQAGYRYRPIVKCVLVRAVTVGHCLWLRGHRSLSQVDMDTFHAWLFEIQDFYGFLWNFEHLVSPHRIGAPKPTGTPQHTRTQQQQFVELLFALLMLCWPFF